MPFPPRRRLPAALLMGWLALLSACGGGGGGGGSSGGGGGGVIEPPPVPVPPAPPPPVQTVLAACPTTFSINAKVPCMVGVYEGQTTDTGAYCALAYDSDGIAQYLAGSTTLRVGLAVLGAGAVYEKKDAANAAGFTLSWSIGIGSGNDIDIAYQLPAEPDSANGLLIKPKRAGVSACRVTAAPPTAATASASTANLLGRNWQAPQLLNGSASAVGELSDQPAFDAGMADDGRAFITFRQPDANGRMAVLVVEGRPGAAGQAPSWTAPQVLDADAPLLAGAYRPRIAVSSNGHAVAAWLSERPCEADSYEPEPAGKNCRYLYASRRLASEGAWEAPRRVRASPPMAAQDHLVRINAQGDAALAFPGFIEASSSLTQSNLALRGATESNWRIVQLNSFISNKFITDPFSSLLSVALDDAGRLFLAGMSSSTFTDVVHARATLAGVGPSLPAETPHEAGVHVYELATSGGYAAYTWKLLGGPYNTRRPEQMTVYSPLSGQWLGLGDLARYAMWGDATLVPVESAAGEFLLYAGCKVTRWRSGAWDTTRSLPTYCGRDRSGGVYAFNRDGDYLGLNWAGRPGQWGYYGRSQDVLLKGAPGSGTAAAGDLVLGTASDAFGATPTQLLLAPGGLALAITTNAYTALPSAAAPAGTLGTSGKKLWAVYLK